MTALYWTLTLIPFLGLLALLVGLFQAFGPRVMPYQIREKAFVITLLGFIPLICIPYKTIRDVAEITLAESIG
jgi:hypothetical protein